MVLVNNVREKINELSDDTEEAREQKVRVKAMLYNDFQKSTQIIAEIFTRNEKLGDMKNGTAKGSE